MKYTLQYTYFIRTLRHHTLNLDYVSANKMQIKLTKPNNYNIRKLSIYMVLTAHVTLWCRINIVCVLILAEELDDAYLYWNGKNTLISFFYWPSVETDNALLCDYKVELAKYFSLRVVPIKTFLHDLLVIMKSSIQNC